MRVCRASNRFALLPISSRLSCLSCLSCLLHLSTPGHLSRHVCRFVEGHLSFHGNNNISCGPGKVGETATISRHAHGELVQPLEIANRTPSPSSVACGAG